MTFTEWLKKILKKQKQVAIKPVANTSANISPYGK